jgi:hypothetical protein
MEFADMAELYPVDAAMIDRTRMWLLGQQQADGSWVGDMSEFFSFHTSAVRNTAFVLWAVASSGYTGPEVTRGLDYVKGALGSDQDAYTLGIAANAFVLAAPNDSFTTSLIANLESMKQTGGESMFWDSSGTQTNFYGGGDDAAVATTALVTHALLLDGGHASTVNGALSYLTGKKDPNGNFGSTQATVWTLRTLLLAATKGTEGAVGTLSITVDGASVPNVVLTADQSDVMTTVDLKTFATPGPHDVALTFSGTGKISYNLVGSHHLPWADVPAEPPGPLAISVDYDKTQLRVNESVEATATVQNTTSSTQNMVLVTVGVPPGFNVRTEDLDAYTSSGALSHYELTGNQLVLYITELGAGATAAFSYALVATMPIVAADGGAEATLYYEPKKKVVAKAKMIQVTP